MDWVPSGKAHSSRTFGDLWQLRLYLPGCDFADVDVQDDEYEARIVRGRISIQVARFRSMSGP